MTFRNVRSYEIGHVYGAVTHDFLPVLGIPHYYKGYSDTPQTEEDADPWKKLSVLHDGYKNIISMKLIEGDFEIAAELYDPPLPSLWSAHDVEVVSKLVYGENNVVPRVFFSVHDTDYTKILYPNSAPKWFIDSDYGRTQFCIYYWLHFMARFPERIKFAYEHLCEPQHYEMAKSLVKDLKEVKKYRMFESFDTFNIKPATFKTNLQDVGVDAMGDDVCTLFFEALDLEFEVWRGGGQEIQDDPEYTKYYTDIFNAYIFELLPVFQRYGVLIALTHGMSQLKCAGLKPSQRYFEYIGLKK